MTSTSAPGATPDRGREAAEVREPWLTLARLGLIVYGLVFLTMFVVGIPYRFAALTTICPAVEGCDTLYLSPLEAAALPTWLSLEMYALYQIVIEVLLFVMALSVAAVIFIRRSHTRMGLVAALAIMGIGLVGEVIPALANAVPLVNAIYLPASTLGIAPIWLFLLVFPDGRIEPAWVRRWFPLFLGLAVVIPGVTLFMDPLVVEPRWFSALWTTLFFATLLFPFVLQVVRYRRHATPEQRQQVKWGLVGLTGLVLGFVFWFAMIPEVGLVPGGAPRLASYLAGNTLAIVGASLVPITVAFSIMRQRLWDIDLVINRALVYGSLTLFLTAIYVGTIVLVQQVILRGQQSPLVVAGSTLLIAALFAPLRRRIQAFIDRRFYRSKYDGQKALAAFAATARAQVDLDALTQELLRVVGDTVQPRQLGLWLKPDAEQGRGSSS